MVKRFKEYYKSLEETIVVWENQIKQVSGQIGHFYNYFLTQRLPNAPRGLHYMISIA